VVWHHTLRRFGADQLNERFRRRFGSEMDGPAWAAWAAVKVLVDGAMRARTTNGAALARHLLRPDSRFDAHKGEPLTFDPRTGELRQPLYLVLSTESGGQRERVATEVPTAVIFPTAPPTARVASCPPDSAKDRR
jgi:ABC-type branched-subunit amino acid transport system substrate-binding protein